jgi:class 3 adenylate cyclase
MISYHLNEALATRYGSSELAGMIKRAINVTQINEAMQLAIAQSFEAECCVVFSDISGFSTRVADKDPEQIKDFLDDYYAYVIPVIYEHGGLIDQMLGDGIISVFSPQLNEEVGPDVFRQGLDAAKKVVEMFAGNDEYSTKCALHKGQAVICNIGDENYRQASLVGGIMTVVHRVESVAKDEAVNMLLSIQEARTTYARVRGRRSTGEPKWWLGTFEADLKGVGEGAQTIFYEKFNRRRLRNGGAT